MEGLILSTRYQGEYEILMSVRTLKFLRYEDTLSQFYKINYYNISVYALWTSAWNTNNIHTPLTEYLHTHVRPVHTYARVRSSIVNKELTVKRAVPSFAAIVSYHTSAISAELGYGCHFYRSFHHVSYCVLWIGQCARFSFPSGRRTLTYCRRSCKMDRVVSSSIFPSRKNSILFSVLFSENLVTPR